MFTVPIETITPASSTTTKMVRLPRAATRAQWVDAYWWGLPAGSRIKLWTQAGPEPNPADSAGNMMLMQFTLPPAGEKVQQHNYEPLCLEIPQGHTHLVLQHFNPEPAAKSFSTLTTFS